MEIIEGIKVEIKSEELAAILRKRAADNRAAAEKLLAVAQKCDVKVEEDEELFDEAGVGSYLTSEIGGGRFPGPNDLHIKAEHCAREARHLKKEAEYTEFAADHLIPKVTYRVDLLAIGAMVGGVGAGIGAYLRPV